jgi:hypothetical protein
MPNGQLVRLKNGYGGFRYKADAHLASQLPDLGLPRMNEAARAAFRAVLDYEKPSGNGSLVDFLALAEARGFCAHPSDWVPDFDDDPQHPQLYQPWVDWLSENGQTPFHEGNNLTAENWDRWKPKPRLRAFCRMLREDQQSSFDLLMAVGPLQPAATRLALLGEINAGGAFYGNYPRQVPMLRYFLADRSAKIRAVAEEKLKNMNGLETEEAHADELAKHLRVSDGSVTYEEPPAPYTQPYSRNFACTTFDLLAKAISLSPRDLARQSDLGRLGSDFMLLITLTGDVETRSIVASRMLEEFPPDHIPIRMFREVARALWERGLRAQFDSEYPTPVFEFPGAKAGSLDIALIRQIKHYSRMTPSVTQELETGKLPVNEMYDPLRILALVASRDATKELLQEARAAGIAENNPRLTMLKFNMAL